MIFTPLFEQLRAEIVSDLERRMQNAFGWWQLSELRDAPNKAPERVIEHLVDSFAQVLQMQLWILASNIDAEIAARLGPGKPLETLSNEELEQRCTAMMNLLAARETAERRHG